MPAKSKAEMTTRKQEKARRDRQDAKARKACVDAVWARANSKCEYCGRMVSRPGGTSFWLDVGHVHEERARSLGGDHTDPSGCKLTCVGCHMPSGAHRRSVRV